jgi:hypothetical protein
MLTLHSLSLYNIVLVACFGCINFFLLFVQMNPNGKVHVFANVPRNLPIPLVSRNLDDILAWNRKVDE